MSYFWVNIGKSYKEVKEHGFLWAPSFTLKADGSHLHKRDWDIVSDVCAGDVIFCCRDNYIIYVAIASKSSYKAPRPENRTFSKWEQEGHKIEVDIVELKIPLALNDFNFEFQTRFNHLCSQLVFDRNLNRCQIYMASIPDTAAVMLLNLIGDDSLDVHLKSDNHKPNSGVTRSGSDQEVISKARVGQGMFRRDVVSLWNNQCPVTGVTEPSLLIASHILSWHLSNSFEKVDKYNGLLLSPNADKLFDRGLISFSDTGELLVSDSLELSVLNKLGIDPRCKIAKLKKENLPYLKRHRELYDFE